MKTGDDRLEHASKTYERKSKKMRSFVRIGNVLGIDIDVYYSLVPVFLLVTVTLAIGYFPKQFPEWSVLSYWTVSITISMLFFVSILIHELAHSLVAKSRGLPVQRVSLYIFGGLSSIQSEPLKPSDELLVAASGPALSVILGVMFWLVSPHLGAGGKQLNVLVMYLGTVNISIAAFNLVPGFPLDGGRVLRAAIWYITGNVLLATRIAVAVGKNAAFLLIFGGLFLAFRGDLISGLGIILIGWSLRSVSNSTDS